MSKHNHDGSNLNRFNILPRRKKPPIPPPDAVLNPASAPSTPAPSRQLAQPSIQSAYNTEITPAPSSFQTGKSVVKEVLEAIRDGSDLFLPLKAALVGIVKIMDIMEVRRAATTLVRSPIWLEQRVGDVQDDFLEMTVKIRALQTIFTTYQSQSQIELALPTRQRLDALAR
jgi:hypothetical protein